MKEFYQFLNNSSGDRIFFYGLVLLITLYIIGWIFINIFDAIARIFKKK